MWGQFSCGFLFLDVVGGIGFGLTVRVGDADVDGVGVALSYQSEAAVGCSLWISGSCFLLCSKERRRWWRLGRTQRELGPLAWACARTARSFVGDIGRPLSGRGPHEGGGAHGV